MEKSYKEIRQEKIEYLEYEVTKLEVELDRIYSRICTLYNEPDGKGLDTELSEPAIKRVIAVSDITYKDYQTYVVESGHKLRPLNIQYSNCDRCGTSEVIGCFCYGAD